MNEAGSWKKRKDGLMVKAVECCPWELDCITASATELLCDAGQVHETKLFTSGP